MNVSRQQPVDDQTLRAYLFGTLPEQETERLDELSVVDDEFAARLDTVETDLVDAYVRGHLAGKALDQFQSVYLSTPRRRDRVAFARSFASLHTQSQAPAPRQSWLNTFSSFFTLPRLAFAGGFAMLLAVSLVVFHNFRPHDAAQQAGRTPVPATSQSAAVAPPPQPVPNDPPSVVQRAASALPVSVAAFVLAPQLRGGAQIQALLVPRGAARVDLSLGLESGDDSNYRATLKNLETDKIVWISKRKRPVTKSGKTTLWARIPANLLPHGIYQLDLTQISTTGDAEPENSYVFEVVTK